MKCEITFRNMEHTEALDSKIREKSEKLKKFFHDEAEINWVCWVQKNDHFAEVKVNDGKRHIQALADSDSLYKTIDLVLDKIQNQVNK